MTILRGSLEASGRRFAVVVSRFNQVVTDRLLAGALEALRQSGASEEDVEVVEVPGAFEIPMPADLLAKSGRFDAVICLGAVIRGETPHFEYISSSVIDEIGRLAVAQSVPFVLGILTTDTIEQALERAGGRYGNKGAEAALTAIEMAALRRLLE
jgi:6,7-dimethyl-8-ribityllumazine synthase